LTAKEAAADQLTKIMQSATKTQDVLDTYQQLQQVDSDIEVLKGQIQYDQEAAQLSAITVHIVAEQTIKPIQVGGWKPQGVARDAIQNLIYFWQGFVNFLITFILLILPVLITIAIPIILIFLLLRWLFRLIFKRKPKVETPKQ
jgi:Flp pilus assembly protein TadB